MDKFMIQGPAKLKGSVRISCSKNAYLPIMSAILLNPHPITLMNLPDLKDIRTMNKLLSHLGVKISTQGHLTHYDASVLTSSIADYDLVKTMRASIFVLGPLLARMKMAQVSLPGGCAIGARPIDIHLHNLEKMNAHIKLETGYVKATAQELVGKELVLSFPSVGATENIMMAAMLAKGVTIIKNAAQEPEVEDLGHFLNAMGGKITGAGTGQVTIEGLGSVDDLKPVQYEAIPDRIEASTFIIAGVMTQSHMTVNNVRPSHLGAVLDCLEDMGAKLTRGKDFVTTHPSPLKGVNVATAPYPGFPTDVQAQMMALMCVAQKSSTMTEHIFENRFMHVPELNRMGANIILRGSTAHVEGGAEFTGAPVMCTDLRASAALVLAALTAKGQTEIQRVYHIDRGYEKVDEKLKNLGVVIVRVNESMA